MPRVCCALLAGMVCGIAFVGIVGAALVEFTGVLENRFHS